MPTGRSLSGWTRATSWWPKPLKAARKPCRSIRILSKGTCAWAIYSTVPANMTRQWWNSSGPRSRMGKTMKPCADWPSPTPNWGISPPPNRPTRKPLSCAPITGACIARWDSSTSVRRGIPRRPRCLCGRPNSLLITIKDIQRWEASISPKPVTRMRLARFSAPSIFVRVGMPIATLVIPIYLMHRFPEAITAQEKAVQMDEGNWEMWGNLADALYWSRDRRADADGKYKRAIVIATSKVQVNPRDTRALAYLANYSAMIGDRRAAMDYIQRVLAIAPADGEVLFRAAVVYNHFNQTEQTLNYLKKAADVGYSRVIIKDSPDFADLQQNPRFVALVGNGP